MGAAGCAADPLKRYTLGGTSAGRRVIPMRFAIRSSNGGLLRDGKLVLETLIPAPSLERRCQCGISQKDGFACAFMDGRHRHPSVGMKQARAIRPTHNARKEVEKWETQ